ncbi:tetratricopeptide repeat protein [Winogradskyella immobilis]|uniref:Tetratricopeptide repeat protein n=1 Tax=Winogradskyella immobilis TaxID=2816852 RepID=A0ABS8EIP7_9FLAO|nr:tetratricopeptide repeat protein [Winogradskyella immobilis]MCC1483076.1 tetratricopeptide repeat protein [Winogradskyella immobilis]MCG0015171.1 tetratricopeptide repeat protein [Winogradskyella immobilis]
MKTKINRVISKLLVLLVFIQFNAEAQSSALLVADSLYAHGNYTKAITAYKTYNNKKEVYHKIAKAYIAIGNYDAALEHYKLSVETNPNDALLKFDYAKLLSRAKKYEDASKIFNELILKDDTNPNYHYEAGIILEKQRDTLALQRYLTAYELDNSHQKAIFKIAKHHLQKRNFETSHSYIDTGLKTYANNLELISLKAQNYYHQEYYTIAIPWFQKLLDLGENSEFIHEKLSLCYSQNSDYVPAIKHRKLALAFNPTDSIAMYVIGKYYEILNDFENAEKFISAALELMDAPLNVEYRTLGVVLNRLEKREEAIKAFKKALKEDPSDLFAEFFIIRTKDEYYADKLAVIKLYEDFVDKHEKNPFKPFAEGRIKELKEEEFLKKD